MRLPGRLRIAWADDTTLRIETDAGTQTRLLPLRRGSGGAGRADLAGRVGSRVGVCRRPGGRTRGGSLKVVTTNLRPGYIRKNGAPYSDKTRVTEYFDLNTAPNGDRWLTVTTKVEDPVYFTRPLPHELRLQGSRQRRRLVAVAVLGTLRETQGGAQPRRKRRRSND